jgi:intracellular septation protein
MKTVLELASALAFLLAWKWYDIYTATIVLNVGLGLAFAFEWVTTRRFPKVSGAVFLISVVMGFLTLYFRDPNFIKFKPSVVYGLFTVVLLGSHFVGDKVLLERIGTQTLALPSEHWPRLNLIWAGFFLFSALLNAAVALWCSEAVWVQVKVYGFTLLFMAFLAAHWPFVGKYLRQSEAQKPTL